MTLVRIVALACMAGLVSLSSVATAQSPAVVALQDWYAGVSVEGLTDRQATFRAFHGKDGSISAVVDGQHRNKGRWRIVEPGHVCVTWMDTSWGVDPCWTVFKDGDLWKMARVDDPSKFVRVQHIEGNAFGL